MQKRAEGRVPCPLGNRKRPALAVVGMQFACTTAVAARAGKFDLCAIRIESDSRSRV